MANRNRQRVETLLVLAGSGVDQLLRAGAFRLRALVLSAGCVLVSSAALAASATCVGDCDDSGTVTVDEIVKGVDIVLGERSLDQCPPLDCNGNGQVTVACLVQALGAALNGCASEPTASPTNSATPTPMNTATRTSTPAATRSATTAAAVVFDRRSTFTSAAGALLTDDYEDPGYAEFQDDASMDAVKAFTRYKTTSFRDFDEVIATPNGHIYAGGFTSGSFQLDFTAPSLGGSGVHAVGFDFANNIPMPYVAFVSFADGTSRNFMLHASAFQFPSPPPDFFGLTSLVAITRIHVGLMDGGATADNLFAIDNLSVAAPEGATTTPAATATPSPTRTPADEAALAASARVATEPLFRFFDFQARVGTAGGVAGRSTVSGCQQVDCVASGHVTGTEEDCCSDRQFTQVFDNCVFDGDRGSVVSLTGSFVLNTDNVDVCTGAIPLGGSFTASMSNFTQDVFFPDGSFSRTFQELNETLEVTPGGCIERQPEQFGFGIRGDGRRFIDGELQQFQSDGFGNVLVDSESDIRALEIAVGSTGEPTACTVTAALNGSLTSADFLVGTQFRTVFTDFQVVQPFQAGALLLRLNGTVGTDCLGDVTLSTIEPVRIASGDTCFTAGRLETKLGDGTALVTYAESAGLDVDLGADGSVDRHFATCTDVPADQCTTSLVGLCGACTALNQCQTGLGCFPCSRNCSGNTSRCSLADTFATCEDGVF
jgi:hypothetical protein